MIDEKKVFFNFLKELTQVMGVSESIYGLKKILGEFFEIKTIFIRLTKTEIANKILKRFQKISH